MPLSTMIFLAAIISAFAAFAIVLAWAERRTHNFRREEPKSKTEKNRPELKKAA